MPFVKLDCGILNSTLWFDAVARDVFITALLMAEPRELSAPTPQLMVTSLDLTGWEVPAGWYGFVPAAGIGITQRARVPEDVGTTALIKLGEPEGSSRSREFDGRRMVRVDGGYIVLNFMRYRDRDYTSAERSKRYRERLSSRRVTVSTPRATVSLHRDITQAEAEAEVHTKKRSAPQARADKPPDPRVKEFLTWFGSEYATRRHGAAYLVRWEKDGSLVKAMLGATDLDRLKNLARIMLADTCSDPFVQESDRGIGILSAKFNWLSDRLAAWEATRGTR